MWGGGRQQGRFGGPEVVNFPSYCLSSLCCFSSFLLYLLLPTPSSLLSGFSPRKQGLLSSCYPALLLQLCLLVFCKRNGERLCPSPVLLVSSCSPLACKRMQTLCPPLVLLVLANPVSSSCSPIILRTNWLLWPRRGLSCSPCPELVQALFAALLWARHCPCSGFAWQRLVQALSGSVCPACQRLFLPPPCPGLVPLLGHAACPFSTTLSGHVFVWL